MKAKALFLVLTIVFLLACGGISTEQLTATAVEAHSRTETAAPTLTLTSAPTFTPTSTPKPTETSQPTDTPTPEPAAIGETVQYNNVEITLLEVVTHTQLALSDYGGYDANDGYIFLDLTVLARNKGNNAVDLTIGDFYVLEEKGDVRNPYFGGTQTVDLERRFNPMASIKLGKFYNGGVPVIFKDKKDTYLRLVFVVTEHVDLIFGIGDSPTFAIPIE
jgi:hypothetical protein